LGAVLVGVTLEGAVLVGAAFEGAAILCEHLLTPFHLNAEV